MSNDRHNIEEVTLDKIELIGLDFLGYHGCLPRERVEGQHFLVDVTLYVDLQPAGITDDLAKTVNYAAVFESIKQIVAGEPCNLIEMVAERIATAILEQYELVNRLLVTVHKPAAPLPGKFNDAAVSIERTRNNRDDK